MTTLNPCAAAPKCVLAGWDLERNAKQMLQVAARYENTKPAPMTRAITEKIKSLSAGPTQ